MTTVTECISATSAKSSLGLACHLEVHVQIVLHPYKLQYCFSYTPHPAKIYVLITSYVLIVMEVLNI
jgi:hypothetical protein